MSEQLSLDQQIAEVAREIAMRERVYPGLVTRRKMRESEAVVHLDRMRAVLGTLQWLQKHESVVRNAITNSEAGS